MTGPLQLTIDCADPGAMVAFWQPLLGYRVPSPPHPSVIRWTDDEPSDRVFVLMAAPEGNEFCLA